MRANGGSGAPTARVDSPTGGGLLFTGRCGTLVAYRDHEVVPVLAAAERAAGRGRWVVGFVSYEAAAALDPALPNWPDDPTAGLPLVWFGVFAEAWPAPPLAPRPEPGRPYTVGAWRPDCDYPAYQDKVAVIRVRIAAGDTYQCNVTQQLRSTVRGDLFEFYRDLALAHGGVRGAYLDTGRFVVASATPELFFDWDDAGITTRPMKGTAARGRWPAEDAARAAWLAGSAKDRAENVMIVDLLRNDLGRIAVPGTVRVPALCELERYEQVWQLTSTVTARPRPEVGLVEVFRALFPCGSVTGAPKRSSMGIIAEVEDSRRGVYCGAVGVLAPPDHPFRARFSVAIRTATVDRRSGAASYGAGGGITWDSDAHTEHRELLAKAAILDAPSEDFQLLETLGYRPGTGLVNEELHLGRLAASAAYFGFRCDTAEVRAALRRPLREVSGPCRVRLLLSRTGTATVTLSPMPPTAAVPVRLVVDPHPIDSSQVWHYHKTTRREAYTARAQRHPDADDVILVNESGQLTETTVANLAVRLDGRWWTPPLCAGCLPGVERGRLLAQGRLAERDLAPTDLRADAGVAVLSSLRGWRDAVVVRPALATGR